MTTSAPRRFTQSALAALVVVATTAPRCFASWMAMVPTPPEPAWMSTFCPFFRFAHSTSTCQAVKATSDHLDLLGSHEPACNPGDDTHFLTVVARSGVPPAITR